jgi:hypothetical protein
MYMCVSYSYIHWYLLYMMRKRDAHHTKNSLSVLLFSNAAAAAATNTKKKLNIHRDIKTLKCNQQVHITVELLFSTCAAKRGNNARSHRRSQ